MTRNETLKELVERKIGGAVTPTELHNLEMADYDLAAVKAVATAHGKADPEANAIADEVVLERNRIQAAAARATTPPPATTTPPASAPRNERPLQRETVVKTTASTPAWIAAVAAVLAVIILFFLWKGQGGQATSADLRQVRDAVITTDASGNPVPVVNIATETFRIVRDDVAKKSDLIGLAKSTDLTGFARTDDLKGLAKKSDLDDLARKDDLKGLASARHVARVERKLDTLYANGGGTMVADGAGAGTVNIIVPPADQ